MKIKKIIIASESSNLYTTKEFLKSATRLKRKAEFLNPYETTLYYPFKKENLADHLYLFRTTGIRFDDHDLLVASHFQQQNTAIKNNLLNLPHFRCKEAQVNYFNQYNIPFVPTLAFRGGLSAKEREAFKKLSPCEHFIIKLNRGNGGIGVIEINGLLSLISTLETFKALKDERIIIQPRLKNFREYRLLLTSKNILGIIEKKSSENDFRRNAHYSSWKLITKLPSHLLQIALESFEKSKLDYAGLDLAYDEQYGPVFFEINAIPGFKMLDELTQKKNALQILRDLL